MINNCISSNPPSAAALAAALMDGIEGTVLDMAVTDSGARHIHGVRKLATAA